MPGGTLRSALNAESLDVVKSCRKVAPDNAGTFGKVRTKCKGCGSGCYTDGAPFCAPCEKEVGEDIGS